MKVKFCKQQGLAAAISVALLGMSFNASADDDSVRAEIELLKQKIAQLEQALAEDREASRKADENLTRQVVTAEETARTGDRVLFESDEPSPALVSADGKKTMEIHGRAFIDVAAIPDIYKYGEVKSLVESSTESEFRKLYLGVEGSFGGDWEYELTIDFAEQGVDLKDANVTYLGWDKQELILGFQKPGFMLENTSSSKYTLFMARGVTDEFSDERALGASWGYSPSWGSMKFGYFVPNSFADGKLEDYTSGETEGGDELIPSEASSEIDRHAFTGRVTWAPIASDNRLVHLGASGLFASYDEPAELKLRARPSAHLADRLVYSKVKDVDTFGTWGLEGALMYDNFFLQAEYLQTMMDAKENYNFEAYYVAASWLLTGESHTYKKESGKFGEVRPRSPVSAGGWGAWEIAARFGQVDLNDRDLIGGKMDTVTLGLNWYLENNLRAMLNWVHFKGYDYKDSSKYVTSQDGDIVEGRLAFYF